MAIVDDGCGTTLYGKKSIKELADKEESEEEVIVEDGFSSSSHCEEIRSMKTEASDSDEDFNVADASSPILARVRATGPTTLAAASIAADEIIAKLRSLEDRSQLLQQEDATSRIASSSSTAPSSVPQCGQASTSWDENYGNFPTIRSYLNAALKRQEDAATAKAKKTPKKDKPTHFFDIDEDAEERHAHMHVAMPRRCYECGGDTSFNENFDSNTYAPAGTCTENREFCSIFALSTIWLTSATYPSGIFSTDTMPEKQNTKRIAHVNQKISLTESRQRKR